MGSVGFDIKDQSHPRTSNGKKYKLPRTLLDDGGTDGHASVPRKLRSAIKKRGRELFTPPLPIFRKQCHGFEPRRDGGKKSKPNTKQGDITKDEEEVAETLYALADMFCDKNKANSPGIENENPETKPTATIEAGSSMNEVEGLTYLVGSIGEVLKFQSLHDTQQPELPTSELPATSSASGNQSEGLSSRSRASNNHIIPSSEQVIAKEKVSASTFQYDKNYCPMDDKINSLFMSHSLTPAGALSSEKPELFSRLTESQKNASSQPVLVGNSVTAVKHNQATKWKRCATHVYISRLIKILKASETKGCFMEKPTQTTQVSTHYQTTGITGRDGGGPFNNPPLSAAVNTTAGIKNDIPWHERPLQDLHLPSENSASCSSANQGYDFLSLGSGVSDLDTSEGINRTGHVRETPKQFQAPYLHTHSQSAMQSSLSQNGYTTTFHGHDLALAAKRVQHPQYPSSTLQQQKWTSHAHLPSQYNKGGINASQLPDWKVAARDSRSMLNYAHTLFPNLHAALGSKYQQFSHPQQQQQQQAINSSQLPLTQLNRHHPPYLPLEFERNGPPFYPENIPQLQVPCSHHLPN